MEDTVTTLGRDGGRITFILSTDGGTWLAATSFARFQESQEMEDPTGTPREKRSLILAAETLRMLLLLTGSWE